MRPNRIVYGSASATVNTVYVRVYGVHGYNGVLHINILYILDDYSL